MKFRLVNPLSDQLKQRVEKSIQSALTTLGVGMKKLIEDEKTFNEAVDIGYEVLPLPVRLFLNKERFSLFVISLKERYISEHSNDQLALPISADRDSGEEEKVPGNISE